MNSHDFIMLIEQLKELLLLSDCYALDEGESMEMLIDTLDGVSERLEAADDGAMEALRQLFVAAGPLHLLALDNGWSEIYDELAEMVESAAQNGSSISLS